MSKCLTTKDAAETPGKYTISATAHPNNPGLQIECIRRDDSLSGEQITVYVFICLAFAGLAFLVWWRSEVVAPQLPGISGREDYGRDDE